MIDGFKKFLNEVVAELRKVTWPTRDEVVGSTWVVIIVSVVMALFIGGVDLILDTLVKAIFTSGVGG